MDVFYPFFFEIFNRNSFMSMYDCCDFSIGEFLQVESMSASSVGIFFYKKLMHR